MTVLLVLVIEIEEVLDNNSIVFAPDCLPIEEVEFAILGRETDGIVLSVGSQAARQSLQQP